MDFDYIKTFNYNGLDLPVPKAKLIHEALSRTSWSKTQSVIDDTCGLNNYSYKYFFKTMTSLKYARLINGYNAEDSILDLYCYLKLSDIFKKNKEYREDIFNIYMDILCKVEDEEDCFENAIEIIYTNLLIFKDKER